MCVSEAPLHMEGTSCPRGWPQHGEITFQDYHMKYRDNTPTVLHGINLTIRSNEVVGIVGRTGSGELSFLGEHPRLLLCPFGTRLIWGHVFAQLSPKCVLGPHTVLVPVLDKHWRAKPKVPVIMGFQWRREMLNRAANKDRNMTAAGCGGCQGENKQSGECRIMGPVVPGCGYLGSEPSA